jgi:hypothetical protein
MLCNHHRHCCRLLCWQGRDTQDVSNILFRISSLNSHTGICYLYMEAADTAWQLELPKARSWTAAIAKSSQLNSWNCQKLPAEQLELPKATSWATGIAKSYQLNSWNCQKLPAEQLELPKATSWTAGIAKSYQLKSWNCQKLAVEQLLARAWQYSTSRQAVRPAHHSTYHRPSSPSSSSKAGQDAVLGRFSTAFGLCAYIYMT